jgi:predicted ester cyclase
LAKELGTYAPDSSGWHHDHRAGRLKKHEVARRRGAMSSAEEHKALVRRLHELVDGGDIEAMEKLLAPDFVDHSLLPDQDPGREGYLQSVAKEHTIFSNIRHIIEDQVAEGDKVTSRSTASRIHDRGENLGVAPTGVEFETTAIEIHRSFR